MPVTEWIGSLWHFKNYRYCKSQKEKRGKKNKKKRTLSSRKRHLKVFPICGWLRGLLMSFWGETSSRFFSVLQCALAVKKPVKNSGYYSADGWQLHSSASVCNPRVGQLMFPQAWQPGKSQPTLVTCVWFNSTVEESMPFQDAHLIESLPTLLTRVWSEPTVDDSMSF